VQHQYVITGKIAGIVPGMATIRDPDRRTYIKEEVGGLAFGGYEPDPKPWLTGDAPENFKFQLLEEDWDHFEQHTETALARLPALATAGIRQMFNGPESFTPDGNFILGEAPEVRNFFVGAGFNAFGIASGGGAGWVLAQWVTTGEQPMDLWVVDIRRFSELHAERVWTRDRTLEAYAKHYAVAYRWRNTKAAVRALSRRSTSG
jgi:4-methylaminobutanoate oxidase (formaldehyde-forming)